MKKNNKIIIIAAGSIVTLGLLALFGFGAFVNSIRSERTCEWANIDNVELHAHIDVPKVTESDCDYEQEKNTKRAFFVIDRNNFNAERYIQLNELKKLHSTSELESGRFINLETSSLISSDLYHKQSSSNGESYDVLFDKTAATLWVTIKYRD